MPTPYYLLQHQTNVYRQSSPFCTRRPKFLDPKEYLDPEFQNLFVLNYMPAGKDTIPSGWSSVDDDRTYPAISSRAPQVPVADDGSSTGSGSSTRNGSESSEGDENLLPDTSSATRMADESEEDEDEIPIAKVATKVCY